MARIRVIAGVARGRRLKLVPGDHTRPIMDRVKEALFNIIQQDLPGCAFLDLFAGTGSVGIEALSRGAKLARFVERDKIAIETIQDNLKLTGFEDLAEVINADVLISLRRAPDVPFDYVFVAPPQYKKIWGKTLAALDKAPDWLVEDGWVIVQIDPREYESVELENLSEFDQRTYGNTVLVFYERELKS